MDLMNDIDMMITRTVALPIIFIIILISVIALYNRRKIVASSRWPMTMGRILTAEVEVREARNDRGGYHLYHFPKVRYEYNVNAHSYTGEQITLGVQRRYPSPEEAEKVIARYPIGGMVEVYYDPNDPAQAILERGSGSYMRILAGMVLMILVVVVLVFTLSAGLHEIMSGVTTNLPK